jgi:Mrp family chromosome partitioning ATPase
MNVLTRDDVQHALAMQSASTVGLHDVLDGKPLEACVHSTDTPLLSILPVGQSGPDLVASLSPASVAQLLEQARQHYDTIVIDTGPIPASTDASLVTAQVDGVILTIRKGVQQHAAERAVMHLRSVGARIAGVVFNGAKVSDMEHSGFSAGASSRMSGGQPPYQRGSVTASSMSDRFGPVARAAALALPSVDEGQGRRNGQYGNGAPRTPR